MGIPVLVLGASGTGKSTSLRNFKEGECLLLNVASKPLPFKGKLDTIQSATYDNIGTALKEQKYKTYIIDDSQYLMAFDLFDRVNEKGFEKFTQLAVRFAGMIRYITTCLPEDVTVYLLHHTEKTDDGRIKVKTIGKMLDEKLTVEGLFTIVLMSDIVDGEYVFHTKNDGMTPCKAPMDMFDNETIENDLKAVDDSNPSAPQNIHKKLNFFIKNTWQTTLFVV